MYSCNRFAKIRTGTMGSRDDSHFDAALAEGENGIRGGSEGMPHHRMTNRGAGVVYRDSRIDEMKALANTDAELRTAFLCAAFVERFAGYTRYEDVVRIMDTFEHAMRRKYDLYTLDREGRLVYKVYELVRLIADTYGK